MPTWLHPVAKTMLLCLDVLPGPAGTENVHLLNVTNSIRPRSDPPFPYRLRRLCVFLQLTDAEGEAPGYIRVRQAESDQVVFESAEHSIQFRDRLQMKWALFHITDCPFPDPGLYLVEFYFAGRWVVDLRLLLNE
jgi:hypothetical protein